MADFNRLSHFAQMAPNGTPEAAIATAHQLAQCLRKDVEGWQKVLRRQGLKIDAF